MTEIVDEFFEHPMARHDDLLDALYYADYYAKGPRSGRFNADELTDTEVWEKNHKKGRSVYNWLTGARI